MGEKTGMSGETEELLALKKKEYLRYASFCEKFIRILEGESVVYLRNQLNEKYHISLENVS